MSKGRSIRLFLADGTPGGIITAEIMNWTGHVMCAPRSRLADLLRRPEAGRTGVYFLTGTDPNGGTLPMVYVGETDNMAKRLAQHNKDESKDFWDHACVVTSKDQNLTKAHARYLESRLIQVASNAGRALLANGTNPDYALLPEADISDMEYFIEQVRVMLPVLGMDFLRDRPVLAQASIPSPTSPSLFQTAPITQTPMVEAQFELNSRKHGLSAQAVEIDGEFIVRAGSLARATCSAGMEGQYFQLQHQRLIDQNILVPESPGLLRFSQDYAFRAPSAASSVIFGRSSNGRKEWQVKGSNRTYAQWQEEQLAQVQTSGADE